MQIPSPLGCSILFSSSITAMLFWPKTQAKTADTRKQEYIEEAHRSPVGLEEWEVKSRREFIFQELSAIACRIYQYEYFVRTSRKHSLSSQESLFSVQAFIDGYNQRDLIWHSQVRWSIKQHIPMTMPEFCTSVKVLLKAEQR